MFPRDLRLALIWGFGEGTLFFLVPDLVVSWVALRNLRRAAVVALVATVGAAVAGVVMSEWGARDPQTALTAVERVPAISEAMVAQVGLEVREHGLAPMVHGALRGKPYKLYAVQAGAQGQAWWAVVLWTFPARLLRFVAIAMLVHGFARGPLRHRSARQKQFLLGGSWAMFYLFFFLLMPN